MITTMTFALYKDERPCVTRIFVWLGKKDTHEWHGFISQGLGCVICDEDHMAGTSHWSEYDAHDAEFLACLARTQASLRWKLTTAHNDDGVLVA